MSLIHLVVSVLAFLCSWTGMAVSGWSAFNEPCSPYTDAYNSCDPFAYLTCEKSTHRSSSRLNDYVCKCSNPDYIWASLVRRCTLRVGSPCFQGVGRSKTPDCPPSSFCDIRGYSYSCKCFENHVSNADGSACNKGSRQLIHVFRLGLDGRTFSSTGILQLTILLPFATLAWGMVWWKT